MANNENVESNDPFQDLDVDRLEVNVVESLCFQCGKNVSIMLYIILIEFSSDFESCFCFI